MTHQNGYMWMLYAWYPQQWWNETNSYEASDCTIGELTEMLTHAIAISQFPYTSQGSCHEQNDIQLVRLYSQTIANLKTSNHRPDNL